MKGKKLPDLRGDLENLSFLSDEEEEEEEERDGRRVRGQ